MASKNGNGRQAKRAHVRRVRLESIRPSPENATLYKPIQETDPDVVAMAESIAKGGVKEPLVITADRWILSGHRRWVAAKVAGQATVPVRIRHDVSRECNRDRFVKLLVEYNVHQRVKTFDEVLREEAAAVDPKEAHRRLIQHRQNTFARFAPNMEIREQKARCQISEAKRPFLEAVQGVLEKRKNFWPLTDRQIHYALLNAPPLIHAGKPDSTYQNDKKSYRALVDLLTRGRLAGHVPWEAIHDPTRPAEVWNVWSNVQDFLRHELNTFGTGFYRNLVQSQPAHVEIIGEKDTIRSIIEPVAEQYTVPYTINRGFCSLPPRYELVQRFGKSGKEELTLLFLTDHDPCGEEIANAFAASLIRDFKLPYFNVTATKVALTAEQVEQHKLPPRMTAKTGSAGYKRFVEEHGDNVFELEALEPATLQELLRDAIEEVIDPDLFNQETEKEEQDAAALEATRRTMAEMLKGLGNGKPDHVQV